MPKELNLNNQIQRYRVTEFYVAGFVTLSTLLDLMFKVDKMNTSLIQSYLICIEQLNTELRSVRESLEKPVDALGQ
jgi:hypothetical protein